MLANYERITINLKKYNNANNNAETSVVAKLQLFSMLVSLPWFVTNEIIRRNPQV